MASQRLTMDITDINKATEYAPHPLPKFEEHDATMAPSKASGTAQFAFTRAAFVFKDRLDNIRGNKAPVIATVPPLEMKVAKQPTIKIEEVTETMPPARASSEVVRLDRRIRILRVVQHALTSSTSVIIAVLQSLTYIKYEQTKGVPDAWPQHPTLGPTILLLAVALMALLFDICSLLAYLMEGQPIADKAYRLALKLHHWLTGLKTFAFTIAASVCRAGFSMGGQQDLWGWSCSPQGQAMDVTNAAHVNCTGNVRTFRLNDVERVVC